MAYDEKCYELAMFFLDDAGIMTEYDREELAQAIQSTIEDYISYNREARK